MSNERLAVLLSRQLAGEATVAELRELHELLKEDPGEQYLAELLRTYWHTHPDQSAGEPLPDQHFAHILDMARTEENLPGGITEISSPSSGSILARFKKLAVAALVAGVIASGGWWYLSQKPNPTKPATVQQNEVVAAKGARTRLVLPDGTRVWLNSDSRLSYDARFNEMIREVTLEGEGYFDVVRNPNRPFVVHTSGIDVRVLGTAFNVKSYPQEATIEATLIHGSIEVLNKKEPKSPKVILRPHEKLVFNKEEQVFQTTSDQPAQSVQPIQPAPSRPVIAITSLPKNIADTAVIETSWVYNKLLFDGDTFRELAVKMERWFNVRISFKNEKVANYRLRGVFENENIEEALQALQFIASFSYQIRGNEVEIGKKQ